MILESWALYLWTVLAPPNAQDSAVVGPFSVRQCLQFTESARYSSHPNLALAEILHLLRGVWLGATATKPGLVRCMQ